MKCPLETREDKEILVAYGSGALNAGDTKLLEGHLQTCSRCREFASGQRVVWEALDTWEAAPVSADFDQRLFARIEQDISWWQRMRGRLGPLIIHRALPLTAVAALLVAGVLLDWSPRPKALPRATTAQVEGLQPEQVVRALDEMEVLNQFDRLMKPEPNQPKM
jgi:anti-sigma factor RsiW